MPTKGKTSSENVEGVCGIPSAFSLDVLGDGPEGVLPLGMAQGRKNRNLMWILAEKVLSS